MRIAVVGGTGTLGSHVVKELEQQWHEVQVLSRHAPKFKIDLVTGEGLREAVVSFTVDANRIIAIDVVRNLE